MRITKNIVNVIQNKPNDLSKEIKVESDLLEKLGIKSFKFH